MDSPESAEAGQPAGTTPRVASAAAARLAHAAAAFVHLDVRSCYSLYASPSTPEDYVEALASQAAPAARAAQPDLGHVPAQPGPRHLGGGSVRGADHHLHDPVRPLLRHPRPPRAGAPGGDGAPHGNVGGAAAHRRHALGPPAGLPDPGPRPGLRRRRRGARRGPRHPDAADAVPRPQGERDHRAGGAHSPERVPGPGAHPE